MSSDIENCLHLDLSTVLAIHARVIKSHGDQDGTRSRVLLEAALATPRATIRGASLYTDLVEIAAAYLFFLCRNHPFFDGNKRVALASCLVFLHINGFEPAPDGPMWEALTLDVASSRLDRDQTTERLRALVAT